MKYQWALLLSIAFALIVSFFAVMNVDSVRVNYFFGEAEWPLILVILASVLMGGMIVGLVGLIRMFMLQRETKALKKENDVLKKKLEEQTSTTEENLQQIEDIH